MALRLFAKKAPRKEASSSPPPRNRPEDSFVPAPREELSADPLTALWQQERFNVILRERQKYQNHPDGHKRWEQAAARLEDQMALVPAGRATFPRTLSGAPGSPETDLEVDPFLLDIHPVTNARFQKFVDAGAYENLELWPKSIWPHLIDLRDQTEKPGPRFWREGRHDQRLANHPVVGISWYEAVAFAKWIGQRLPTEAEWQMAATWRIRSDTDILRRFPWGDAMNRTRCNIWSSGIGTTVAVDALREGVAPNGVLGLIGNVWEWVDGDFSLTSDEGAPILAEMELKGTRGGAFDTYFENQATGLFRTGHIALGRLHNVGLRCAMSLNDASWLGNVE